MSGTILFDGVCNLCNGFVRFVIARDPEARFRFAALAAPAATQVLRQAGVSLPLPDSIVFIEDGKAYVRSAAALRIARGLRFPWPLLYGFILVPRFLRDRVYDVIAARRYRWFGRRDACMMPAPALRRRFLESQEVPGPPRRSRSISGVSAPVIEVSGLTRRFGAKTALASVSLSLPRGAVYGLVGANGAGKTTLIRHMIGLLRAESGSVRVFGLDPVADPVGVLSRIGYLSEENDLPGWMRVEELIRYSRAFYPAWDDAYAEELRREFALEASATIRTLSKGQKARAGLLVALAYRPDLLPSTNPPPVSTRSSAATFSAP